MANANTQLNRVYVQTIDSTGTNDPTLRLGTKTLTTTVQVGGVGTGGNSINVSTTGINMSGPLNASRISLTNTSTVRLDVTGLTNLQNVSVSGVLDVVGKATMGNVSTTALTATTLFATTINATGLSTLSNVSVTGNVSVKGKMFVSDDFITPYMSTTNTATINNASINGTLKVNDQTTLRALDVNGGTTFNNTVTLSGSNSLIVGGTVKTDTIEGSGSSVDMELGKTITTGKIKIGETQTDGALNIGQKVGRTGNINIGTELAGGAVNIGTNMGGSGSINIGTAAKNTTINGIVNAAGLTGFAKTGVANTFDGLQTMNGGAIMPKMTISNDQEQGLIFQRNGTCIIGVSSTSPPSLILGVEGGITYPNTGINVGIGTYLPAKTLDVSGTIGVTGLSTLGGMTVTGATNINTTGTLNTAIGNSTSGLTVNGAGIKTNTLEGIDNTVNHALFSSKTTGSLSVGTSMTSGTISMGGVGSTMIVKGNTSLQNVSAQNTTVMGMLTVIGNTSVQNVSAQALTVGSLWAGGTTAASLSVTGDLLTNTIKSTTNSTTFSLCDNQTDGQIDIAGGVSRTGNINIGYNIGGGSIHIGANARGTHNIVVGTNASSSTYIRGKDINVGDNQTTGTIEIGSASTRTGTINIGKYTKGDIIIGDTSTAGTSNYILIGTANLSKTYVRGGTVVIQDGTSAVSIGSGGGNTTIGAGGGTLSLGSTTTSIAGTLGVTGITTLGTTNTGSLTAPDIKIQNDKEQGLIFQRNGTCIIGVSASSPPSLILGVEGGTTYPNTGGNVGIGTTAPTAPLHVGTSNSSRFPAGSGAITGAVWWNQATTNTTLFGSGTFAPGGTAVAVSLSIYSADNILTANSYISNSDRRIKANIIDVDDDKALRDLRLLKPKTYTYKDTITRGTEPVYGFIAQEVKEVLNYASSFNKEALPNIYELATFSTDTLTLTFNTADLSRDASGALFTKLKVKTKGMKDEYVNIVEVIDEHTIKVDKDLTEWGGTIDASGQLVSGNQIFVYGQEVNDFHTLNKDAIWTVATAALQEVDRQLQAEKQKTADLQTTLASVLARLDALEQQASPPSDPLTETPAQPASEPASETPAQPASEPASETPAQPASEPASETPAQPASETPV